MTTLAGIAAYDSKNNGKNKGVVLASDVSTTYVNPDNSYTKAETRKLFVDKSRNFAVCMSGLNDELWESFRSDLLEGKIDIKKAIEGGRLDELRELNLSRMNDETWDELKSNSMLIAARFDNKPRLYTCWPLGKIAERRWTCVGSGSKLAENYIDIQEYTDELSVDKAVDLAYRTIKRANKDLYTNGFDLVTVREDGITEYHDKIKSNLESAEKSTLLSIIEENKR